MAGKLRSNVAKMREIFNNNDITFWSRDSRTGKVTVSEGNAKIYGVSREEFEKSPNLWFDSIHHEDKSILLDSLKKQESGKRTKVVYRIFRSDGQLRWVEDRGTPTFNKKGEITTVDGVLFDVTNQKKTEKHMHKMAYHDSLTELPNRNWFQSYLASTILSAKKHNGSIAIMFIDYDNFKKVNDTLGHNAGDILLKQMAIRLQSCVRKDDIVSRQGGDEFLIMLENTSAEEVEEIAARIISTMNHPYKVKGNEVFSTPSIGISFYPEGGNTAEALIERADFAMYLAKERGKNNYQFYNEELNQKMKRKLMLEVRLHKAVEHQELSVHYQPQINLTTGNLAGAEALLRWKCDLGIIGPGEFIPIAEETGLIIPIGEWVLTEACRQTSQFRQNGIDSFPVSVNISSKQLMHPHFIGRLENILNEEQADPSLLTLEITESSLLFYEDAKHNISKLRKLGVGISIDDFGVGYSSLSMIKNIEMDELKIDQSFLIDALESKRISSLLETIILIGKNLEAKVVVEGIETAQQLELLMKHNVFGQGYFYSRPLPADEFEKWYHRFYTKAKIN
ncbi:bifunctional diguanylate cyclase/phosphodiesterase [Aquibacillus saliphilus]|uniref:bifunctional diguanylate cyclase/phosphodiesterase n=1 Tax=Aquibacillus saliphilus TaxID=1909422 RepID=UPI001CEFD09F|nr:GGDEF domain-containing phosphodiesterase [Aquibacillus saliphilus]